MTKVRKVCEVLLAIFVPLYILAFTLAHLLYDWEIILEILKQQIVIFAIVSLLSLPVYEIVIDIRNHTSKYERWR